MLTLQEKQKIKEILAGLNINPNINFKYFLNCINETNDKVKSLDSKIQMVLYNQEQLNQKLDKIIRMINN